MLDTAESAELASGMNPLTPDVRNLSGTLNIKNVNELEFGWT